MFNQLFTCPRTIERHLAAPFMEQRQRYLHFCRQRGASQTTLRITAAQLLVINDYLTLDTQDDISLAQIEAAADRWIQRPNQRHRRKDSSATRTKFVAKATHWLSFLSRLCQEPATPCPEAHLLAAFVHYMEYERGWSPQTIRTRRLLLSKLYQGDRAGLRFRASRLFPLRGNARLVYPWARSSHHLALRLGRRCHRLQLGCLLDCLPQIQVTILRKQRLHHSQRGASQAKWIGIAGWRVANRKAADERIECPAD